LEREREGCKRKTNQVGDCDETEMIMKIIGSWLVETFVIVMAVGREGRATKA